MYKVTCEKCNGEGIIEAYAYIKNGECSTCRGQGYLHFNDRQLDSYLKRHPNAWFIKDNIDERNN